MESNSFLDSPTIPRSLGYRTPKKKQASTTGDRFIPTRQTDPSLPEPSLEPRTPKALAFQERLNTATSKLTPYASASPTPKNLLFFGSPQKHRVFNQVERQGFHDAPRKKGRHLYLDSFRVLDAPDVDNNFYNQVLTWSKTDHLSIALNHDDGSVIYSVATNATEANVTFRSTKQLENSNVYSLASLDEEYTISGWHTGYIRLHQTHVDNCDYHYTNLVSSSPIHSIAVTSPYTVMCGNATDSLTAVDFRQQRPVRSRVRVGQHAVDPEMQVPGLTYDGGVYLASGSNGGEVSLWDMRALGYGPVHTHTTHTAAIKALEFLPYNTRYLISGGGTACKHLALWDTTTHQIKDTIDTGGQVTGIHCLRSAPRYFVTSHGYSDFSIKLWRIEKSKMVLKSSFREFGRRDSSSRAFCLAGSPNTHNFATVTSNETLHFFNTRGLPDEKKQSYQVMPGFSQEFSGALVIR
ncbi:MAG: WD40 repeat domain-containing protein [Legionellaceae bacterium]|nr:WD40 repeat domain-containing protein [Legionellaceae bacterium]